MRIRATRTINAPTPIIWEYLRDYANIHRFHPGVRYSEFTEGTTRNGMDSTRICYFHSGDSLRERVTEWKEGEGYTVEIYESTMPFRDGKASLGVRELPNGQSQAYMEMEWKPTKRWMAPMMYLMFRFKAAPSILKGLEDLYRSEHTLHAFA